MMKIEISLDERSLSAIEALAKALSLKTAITATQTEAKPEPPKMATPAKPVTPEAPKVVTPATPAEPAPALETPTEEAPEIVRFYSVDELRKAGASLIKTRGRETLKEVLGQFNLDKISDCQIDQSSAVMDALVNAMGVSTDA